MNTREAVRVEGTPFIWTTNLTDEEVHEFYRSYRKQISEPDRPADTSRKIIIIRLRIGFLPFQEGFCLWHASGQKHTVLYRTNRDWELWDARQKEIEELRQEQGAEEAVEKELVMTEDTYLREKTESAIKAGAYDSGATYMAARAELRKEFGRFRGMPPNWSYWSPDLIFAKFPTSRHGIEFFRRYYVLPRTFANFAHWYSARCGLHGEENIEETRAIYEEGMRIFPESGYLAKAASLFWRRVGQYDLAMTICAEAMKRGLRDGTKSGFEGRLKRLQRQAPKGP